MKVERITLRNFRNIRESTFVPNPQINFLVGPNGQGKTSFIEAIGFLSMLRSFRGAKTASVIRWGTRESEISSRITSASDSSSSDSPTSDWKTDLKITFQATDPAGQKIAKTAYINNKPYKSSTQYLVQRFGAYELGFHSIVFNPSDHDLIRNDPATRRAYLDRVLCAESGEYLRTLQKYHRTLEQRNALLKESRNRSAPLFSSFTEQLCSYGTYIVSQRLKWIQNLNQLLTGTLDQIAPRQSELKMCYISNWSPEIEYLSYNNNSLHSVHFTGQGHLPSLELLEQSFWTKVSVLETAEWATGHSLVGPHRDDWTFFLGAQTLKGHGSQGEVRSALLALKLCEIELFRNETGHRPLFLLDDFSSELDMERRSFLLQFLKKTDLQSFVTTTEDSYFVEKQYWVRNGAIEEGQKKEDHDHRTETVRLE